MLHSVVNILVLTHICVSLKHDICKDVETHPNLELLPTPSQCGKFQGENRIMGGKETRLGEYPWMVLLLAKDLSSEDGLTMRFCGGALISDRYVLTAAHCIDEFMHANKIRLPGNLYKMFVRLGEHNLITQPDTKDGVTAPLSMEYKVESWLAHEQYKSMGSFYNDIALLRLKNKVKFHDFVKPVCLPRSCKFYQTGLSGKRVTIAGWGSLMDIPKVSSMSLQKVNIQVKETARDCPSTRYKGRRFPTLVTQLCAGSFSRDKIEGDACTGDSGGPLVYLHEEEDTLNFYQVGIVSVGEPCSLNMSGSPGIYTRVSTFMPWILNHMSP